MKRAINILALGLISTLPGQALAQAITNTSIERDIHREKYLRLNYGNDFFTKTDFDLTQAVNLELVHPSLSRSLIYKILYRQKNQETRYGVALEHNAYTPVYYERKEIQYGDRPFAGVLFLKMFTLNTDVEKKQRITSSLSTGIIGQASGAKQMQVYIHENTPNVVPQGWDNQIQNDVVLNYEFTYQKQVLAIDHFLLATADGLARLGSLNTKANIGFTLMAGYFDSPFATLNIKGKKIRFYAYDHPEFNVVGYDATLQGGLLNHTSPYTIATNDVQRLVFRNNWGIVVQFGKIYLEYYQFFATKEFRNGMDHRNGGIQIGFVF
jgi:lipid A 3-O-deacylase